MHGLPLSAPLLLVAFSIVVRTVTATKHVLGVWLCAVCEGVGGMLA